MPENTPEQVLPSTTVAINAAIAKAESPTKPVVLIDLSGLLHPYHPSVFGEEGSVVYGLAAFVRSLLQDTDIAEQCDFMLLNSRSGEGESVSVAYDVSCDYGQAFALLGIAGVDSDLVWRRCADEGATHYNIVSWHDDGQFENNKTGEFVSSKNFIVVSADPETIARCDKESVRCVAMPQLGQIDRLNPSKLDEPDDVPHRFVVDYDATCSHDGANHGRRERIIAVDHFARKVLAAEAVLREQYGYGDSGLDYLQYLIESDQLKEVLLLVMPLHVRIVLQAYDANPVDAQAELAAMLSPKQLGRLYKQIRKHGGATAYVAWREGFNQAVFAYRDALFQFGEFEWERGECGLLNDTPAEIVAQHGDVLIKELWAALFKSNDDYKRAEQAAYRAGVAAAEVEQAVLSVLPEALLAELSLSKPEFSLKGYTPVQRSALQRVMAATQRSADIARRCECVDRSAHVNEFLLDELVERGAAKEGAIVELVTTRKFTPAQLFDHHNGVLGFVRAAKARGIKVRVSPSNFIGKFLPPELSEDGRSLIPGRDDCDTTKAMRIYQLYGESGAVVHFYDNNSREWQGAADQFATFQAAGIAVCVYGACDEYGMLQGLPGAGSESLPFADRLHGTRLWSEFYGHVAELVPAVSPPVSPARTDTPSTPDSAGTATTCGDDLDEEVCGEEIVAPSPVRAGLVGLKRSGHVDDLAAFIDEQGGDSAESGAAADDSDTDSDAYGDSVEVMACGL